MLDCSLTDGKWEISWVESKWKEKYSQQFDYVVRVYMSYKTHTDL